MSITTCRECGKEVSSEAEKCPSCGVKNPGKSKHVFNIMDNIFITILAVFFGLGIIGYLTGADSKASCELLSRSIDPDVFVINGQPDAGYRYNVQVKNKGENGEIRLVVGLSSSEGEYERKQSLVFDSQEVRDLSYTFYEPTVNATNIQGRVTCKP